MSQYESNQGTLTDTCEMCEQVPHPQATHCKVCHATWTRTSNTAHCVTCHRTFSTPGVFDKHLLSRGCQDPAEVRTKRTGEPVYGGTKPNAWGTDVWRLPSDPDRWATPEPEEAQQ